MPGMGGMPSMGGMGGMPGMEGMDFNKLMGGMGSCLFLNTTAATTESNQSKGCIALTEALDNSTASSGVALPPLCSLCE